MYTKLSGATREGATVKQRHSGLEQMYAARFWTMSLTLGLKSSLSICFCYYQMDVP
jgi:hypothetical protein